MSRRSPARVLTTVLFTDIVGSTEIAEEMGDRRWHELQARHHDLVRKELKRYGGREVDTAGDGFLATFNEPVSGIRCASAIVESVRTLGIEIRAGLHTGEAEVAGSRVGGIAVHIGARALALAKAGEVIVSDTVKDLVSGADVKFADRGLHTLKGVAGERRLFVLNTIDGSPVLPPLEAAEAIRRREEIHPLPLIRRRRSAVVIGMALIGAIAVILILVTRNDTLPRIPTNHVGRIDPATGEIRAALRAGSPPTALAAGEDSLWVASLAAQTLTRFDLRTGEDGPTVSTQGSPTAVAVDESGTVWVLNQFEATVVRINPDGHIEDSIQLDTGTRDIAVGEEAVWVTNEQTRTLIRIEPRDSQTNVPEVVLDSSRIRESPRGVETGGGFVWIASGAQVLKVDPRSYRVVGTSDLRFVATDVVYGERYLWVTHVADHRISRVDPTTLAAVAIGLGSGPAGIATGGGFAWVISEEGAVVRVEPDSTRTLTIPVGSTPAGIVAAHGSVWVSVNR